MDNGSATSVVSKSGFEQLIKDATLNSFRNIRKTHLTDNLGITPEIVKYHFQWTKWWKQTLIEAKIVVALDLIYIHYSFKQKVA